MEVSMLSGASMPFCPGCGHGPSVKFLSQALEEGKYDPLDIILVSDIGCCGLIDPLFNTHTIHGLHGRSPALAMGVAMGLNNPDKKIIVIQGDGGATIGLQHLMEASRRNLDITILILNNLIYGMTGGQVSGLSTSEFKYEKSIVDDTPPFDVCLLAHHAGAAFVSRVNKPKKVSEAIVKGLNVKGLSLVEISSLCQPYGAKKLTDLSAWSRPETELTNKFQPADLKPRATETLLSANELLTPVFTSSLKGKLGILMAGSAGGGVQSAAKLLAEAGILSGLFATMKGEYPITVGTGFSVAEVILSNEEIRYTGLENPDVVLIVTNDGLKKVSSRISPNSKVFIDKQVELSDISSENMHDFIGKAGKKGAALSAITYWLAREEIIDIEALRAAVDKNKHRDKLLEIIDGAIDDVAVY